MNKLIQFIETSFLKELLNFEDLTDIYFNGTNIIYETRKHGRKVFDNNITGEVCENFIRHIANIAEKQFSYMSPILDVSIGRYRINAVHNSICRVNEHKSISFSIRVTSNKLVISEQYFDNKLLIVLIDTLIENRASMIIAGLTGSGKTELQKYMISRMNNSERLIVIDNVKELENIRVDATADITSWQVDEANRQDSTFKNLIVNALRNNPDWLIVAEIKGKEMEDVLNCVMTGHPIITTVHSKSVTLIPHRLARMISTNNDNFVYKEVLNDVLNHIDYYLFVKKYIDKNGKIIRTLDSVGKANIVDKKVDIIYDKNFANFGKISAEINYLKGKRWLF